MRNPSSSSSSLKAAIGKSSSSSTVTPCCAKVGLKRGPWTPEEDKILSNYINKEGEGRWRTLPKRAGLLRCGKSCRLRWMNYLRPCVKRGQIASDEEDIILRLHRLLGNRWSLIAGRIQGRTDNEIKNYWNTHLSKKLISQGIDPRTHKPLVLMSTNTTPAAENHTTSSSPPPVNLNNGAASSSKTKQHRGDKTANPSPKISPNITTITSNPIIGGGNDDEYLVAGNNNDDKLGAIVHGGGPVGYGNVVMSSSNVDASAAAAMGGNNNHLDEDMNCCTDDVFSSFLNSLINEDPFAAALAAGGGGQHHHLQQPLMQQAAAAAAVDSSSGFANWETAVLGAFDPHHHQHDRAADVNDHQMQ